MDAVAFVSRDIHEPKLAQVRLDLLSRLGAMVGSVDYEDVADALASVPVPDLADWCAVNLVEDRRIIRTSVAQCDPTKAALRDAVRRAAREWTRNPLWTEMRLTSGFQLAHGRQRRAAAQDHLQRGAIPLPDTGGRSVAHGAAGRIAWTDRRHLLL